MTRIRKPEPRSEAFGFRFSEGFGVEGLGLFCLKGLGV